MYVDYTKDLKSDMRKDIDVNNRNLTEKFVILEQLVSEIEKDHRKVRLTVSSFAELINKVFIKLETLNIERVSSDITEL